MQQTPTSQETFSQRVSNAFEFFVCLNVGRNSIDTDEYLSALLLGVFLFVCFPSLVCADSKTVVKNLMVLTR